MDEGLPFFIQNEINDPNTVTNLREWQRRFWMEAYAGWNHPDWNEPRSQQRLLQHACTGAGKFDIIAMAPFAGARDRFLVVVPTLAILDGLQQALGAPARQHVAPRCGRGFLDLFPVFIRCSLWSLPRGTGLSGEP